MVGVVDEDDSGRAAGICAYKEDREASVQEGIAEEDHVVIAGRYVDGCKLLLGRLGEEYEIGDDGHACSEAGIHRGEDWEKRGGREKIGGSVVDGWAVWGYGSVAVDMW